MSQYHHFTMFEREKIFFFRAQNKSIRFIAKELGRSLRLFPESLNVILLITITVLLEQRKTIRKDAKNVIALSCFLIRHYLLLFQRCFLNSNGHRKKLPVDCPMNVLI